jgi:2-phosphosulfolactate phosphatase
LQIKLIPVATASNPEVLKGTTAVVFDVLRATSTIVTALASGYRRVYPVAEAGAAMELAYERGYVLAGERGGEKIAGFPHGNSPLEFIHGLEAGGRASIGGKYKTVSASGEPGHEYKTDGRVLVLTTSNGTGAIRWAASADMVLIGSLLNARAAALAALGKGRNISLVCAGTAGCFSFEDTLGAGFVLVEIMRQFGRVKGELHAADLAMDDLATAAYGLASFYHDNPLSGLRAGQHGQKLLQLGRENDLRWCAKLNQFDIAPVFTREYIAIGS